jgi:hypothetical protein
LPGQLPGQLPGVTVGPAPGSPESYAQASSIIGRLAKGIQGSSAIQEVTGIGSILKDIADGLAQGAKGAKSSIVARQLPAGAAPGSLESFQQASSIIAGLAKGLQGTAILMSGDISNMLGSLAQGLGQAGKAGKSS